VKKLLFVMMLASCGGAQKDHEMLTDSIRSYNDGLRWQRYEIAASQVPPKERADFVDEMDERGDNLKITDYEVVKVDTTSSKEARVQVKVSWYLDDVGTLKETHAEQTWERHGKVWWMVGEARVRGDEMPGLPEPGSKIEDRETAKGPADQADPAGPTPPSVN